MARNVRNFWVDAQIDGRSSTLSGGPVGRDGGLDATFYIRDKGEIVKAVTVSGFARHTGELRLVVRTSDGQEIEVTGQR